MSKITIVRTDHAMPEGRALEGVREFLFGVFDGFRKDDRSAWRRFWKRAMAMDVGEMADWEMIFPRSGPYHRRHMKIEQAVFDAQERFDDFETFRDWTKVGAAWVVWVPGPKGGIVPLPKSISYAKADQAEFEQFHHQVMDFLRGPHAAVFLWKHLGEAGAADMMDRILMEFGE